MWDRIGKGEDFPGYPTAPIREKLKIEKEVRKEVNERYKKL